MRHLALAVSAVLMTASLTSCHDPLGALLVGLPYQLARVNGAGLPWTTPYGGTIDEGWIKIVDDTLAQLYERRTSPGSVTQWRYGGKYRMAPTSDHPIRWSATSNVGRKKRAGIPGARLLIPDS
jgi:hypothetical protein